MKKHYLSAYSGLPRGVYFLFAARLVNSMGYFISPLLTLILTQKLGMGKADAGSTVALLILTQAPCVLLGGRLADTIGRKKTLAAGSGLGALFYLVCGIAAEGKAMVYCIILAADMVAVAMPAADAFLADLTKPEERQPAYSLIYLGANIGMAVSPIIGGLLFNSHLRLVFILDALTSLVSIAIVVVNIKDDYVPLRRKKAEGGSAKGPGLFGALRKAPLLTLFILLLFFFDFCYSQWNFMLPAQFGDRYAENGARLYSALSSVNAVTVIFMTPLITRLTRRLPPLKAVALSGLFFLVSYIGFAFEGSFALCFVLAVVFTLGEICSAVQIGAYVSNSAPPDCLGRINSFSTLVRGAASAVGPMAMGQLLTQVNYTTGWLVTAAIVLAAGIGMFALNTLGDKGRYKNEVQ